MKNAASVTLFGSEYNNVYYSLCEIVIRLIRHEDGLQLDNPETRDWGLYNSSIYHVLYYKMMEKIIEHFEKWLQVVDV
jgi:hypothetical protein